MKNQPPPKNDFPEKASPLALSIIAEYNEEGKTLPSDHSNTLALSRIQAAKKPWHNSHLSYKNIILKPTPSCKP